MNNPEVMNAEPIDTRVDNREVPGKTTRQEVDPNINQIVDKSSTERIERIEFDSEKKAMQEEIINLKNRVIKIEDAIQALVDRGLLNPQNQEKF